MTTKNYFFDKSGHLIINALLADVIKTRYSAAHSLMDDSFIWVSDNKIHEAKAYGDKKDRQWVVLTAKKKDIGTLFSRTSVQDSEPIINAIVDTLKVEPLEDAKKMLDELLSINIVYDTERDEIEKRLKEEAETIIDDSEGLPESHEELRIEDIVEKPESEEEAKEAPEKITVATNIVNADTSAENVFQEGKNYLYAMQCTDRNSGSRGTFMYEESKPFYAVSPVFPSAADLFDWIHAQGYVTEGFSVIPESKPKTTANSGKKALFRPGRPYFYFVENNPFHAEVRTKDGTVVFEIPDDAFVSDMIDNGFLKNKLDVNGIEKYLKEMGRITTNSWIEPPSRSFSESGKGQSKPAFAHVVSEAKSFLHPDSTYQSLVDFIAVEVSQGTPIEDVENVLLANYTKEMVDEVMDIYLWGKEYTEPMQEKYQFRIAEITEFISDIEKRLFEKSAVIAKEKDGYYVRSETGKNLGGPYASHKEAEERLQEVEYFKHRDSKSLLEVAEMLVYYATPRYARQQFTYLSDSDVVWHDFLKYLKTKGFPTFQDFKAKAFANPNIFDEAVIKLREMVKEKASV
jgi:hypothetical protein